MSFKTAKQIWETVAKMREAGAPRSRNRARINSCFNGDPPYTDQEARDNRIETNTNFLEGTRIISQARQQITSAFMKPQRYFSVSLDTGPILKRSGWGRTITKQISQPLKRSMRYWNCMENQLASAVLHGPGPATWLKKNDWCPVPRGVDDMLIPSNTLQSLCNLDHFAVRMTFTAAELLKATSGQYVDKGWNTALVKKIAPALIRLNAGYGDTYQYQDYEDFERQQENIKENAGFWGSDAIATLKVYDFYYQDTEGDDDPVWRRKIIVDREADGFAEFRTETQEQFLYDGSDKDYGKDVSQLMHVQFADGCVVPPFRWHSVRSLGYLLYSVCHLQNRVRCKMTDAIFEHMLWYFRNVSEGDKERLEMVNLTHLGIIPQGLEFITGPERHTVDFNLLNGYIAGNRQLMQESASSYVQGDQQKGATPPSATQVIANVNAANALIGSMLTRAYKFQEPGYREVCRRFATSDHKDCVKFRHRCEADGVDKSVWENFEAWQIEPDRIMGSGNQMLAIAQSDRLWAIRPTLSPRSQEEVKRMFVESTTDDPSMADKLVPIEEEQPTSQSVEKAGFAFPNLMLGNQVLVSEPINRIEFTSTLVLYLQSEVKRAMAGTPDPEKLPGFVNVVQTIEKYVQEIAQDEAQKPLVKEYMEEIVKAAEFIKKYAEAIQEASQQQGGPQIDPETQAKIQAMIITAQTKAKIQDENAAQKRQQKEIAFIQDQSRKDASLTGELATGDLRTRAEIARANALSHLDAGGPGGGGTP